MISGPGRALCIIASLGNDISCDSAVTLSCQYRTDVTNKPYSLGGANVVWTVVASVKERVPAFPWVKNCSECPTPILSTSQKLAHCANMQFSVTKTSFWQVILKIPLLFFISFRVFLATETYKVRWYYVCSEFLEKWPIMTQLWAGWSVLMKTFHLTGWMSQHSLQMWGSENPHEYFEHDQDSPYVQYLQQCEKEKSMCHSSLWSSQQW